MVQQVQPVYAKAAAIVNLSAQKEKYVRNRVTPVHPVRRPVHQEIATKHVIQTLPVILKAKAVAATKLAVQTPHAPLVVMVVAIRLAAAQRTVKRLVQEMVVVMLHFRTNFFF